VGEDEIVVYCSNETCYAWGRLAEVCKDHLNKGKQVYVEDTLQSQTWEGNDGQTHFGNNITLRDIQFLGPRDDAPEAPAGSEEIGCSVLATKVWHCFITVIMMDIFYYYLT